jgi:hypothetical protein
VLFNGCALWLSLRPTGALPLFLNSLFNRDALLRSGGCGGGVGALTAMLTFSISAPMRPNLRRKDVDCESSQFYC